MFDRSLSYLLSSTLIEADVKTLRREIKELKAETAVLSQKVRNQKNTQSAATPSQSGTHTDARYPIFSLKISISQNSSSQVRGPIST